MDRSTPGLPVHHQLPESTQIHVHRVGDAILPYPSGSKESACQTGEEGLIPGSGDPLEKKMATYSSVLAWEIPWPEELGRLQSMGSQKT